MRTIPGAQVARARLAAREGRPIPTKQVRRPASARDAATVIMSSALGARSTRSGASGLGSSGLDPSGPGPSDLDSSNLVPSNQGRSGP
ncbi:hypothetical protein GCM10009853_026850 [Glycomyces scopariae]